MCGIAGFFEHSNHRAIAILDAMLSSQKHRGPDAQGSYLDTAASRCIALGHRRLSIIDISQNANQPMQFEHLTIVYNGEVYNFAEIRQILQKEGYFFDTDGDTEVILKAFHKWNVAAIHHFRGMFAFCIYDNVLKKAYLVRDRVGTKPLYVYHDEHCLLFASELQSLQQHPRFKLNLSSEGMHLYFQYGYIPAPTAIFSNTQKILPGHYLEYDVYTNIVTEKKYWDLSDFYILPKFTGTEEEATKKLHTLLLEAFSLRMIADVPVGVLLSGGIDSSLITAILQATSSRPLETFTMAFEDTDYDESTHAQNIAAYLGTHHHVKKCTWKDAQAVISQSPHMYSEPFADHSSIPTALISQFARQSVTVALSGDGGDELFCGYPAYQLNASRFNRLDNAFIKSIIRFCGKFPERLSGLQKINTDLYQRYLKLKSVTRLSTIEEKYASVTCSFMPEELKRLFCIPLTYTLSQPCLNEVDSIERMMLQDFKRYLPDNLMVKVDRATMFYSLEGREPLLDHKILEYAAGLPIQMKLQKRVLKNILQNYLPPVYFERKKQGFGVPVNTWLRNELNYLIKKYLNKEKIQQQGIFNHHYIIELRNAFMRRRLNDNKIWMLLVFQMWYEAYLGENF